MNRRFIATVTLLNFFSAVALADETAAPSASQVASLAAEARGLNWSDATSVTVTIHAPIEAVWTYASDSSRARDWSVFFDHIHWMPGSAPDGQVGAVRRCFRRADERGIRWDEITLESVPRQLRRIYTYNLQGFFPEFVAQDTQYYVTQRYERVDANTSRLTFAALLVPQSGWLARFFYRISAGSAKRVFRVNLENIAAAVEQKAAYRRPHPYEGPGNLERLLTL